MPKKTRSKRSMGHEQLVARRKLRELLNAQPASACYDDVVSVALRLYEGIDTPLSRHLAESLRKGRIDEVANCVVKHENYASVDSFYVDYCAANFLRKWEDLGNVAPNGLDPEGAARASFFRAEALCRDTNEVFHQLQLGLFQPKPLLARVLRRAKRLIKDCLGGTPKVSELQPRFGPGATSACSGESVTVADKLIAYPECTMDAVRIVSGLPTVSPSWFHLLARLHSTAFYDINGIVDDFGDFIVTRARCAPKLVRGNRFATVPKTAKTHRGICIEPHTNSIYQLAVGSILTDKLAAFGLPKSLLQDVHKRLARVYSLTGTHATIDLSMASDTIAYKFVEYMLPRGWFNLLAELRSPETLIEDQWIELEKFSSMGNGYTFELEMLIFYALARATADELGEFSEVSAYGDDIIIPAGCISAFYEVLHLCGFIVNPDKSFCNVGFNESCGGDFFRGADVRPYFLKESPKNAAQWITVVNGIRRMAVKHSYNGELDPRFLRAWLRAIAHIPKPFRFQGPEAQGDWWIHTDESHRWNVSTRGQVKRYRALVPVPRKHIMERYCSVTCYVAMLYGVGSDGYSLRGDPIRYRAAWIEGPDGASRHSSVPLSDFSFPWEPQGPRKRHHGAKGKEDRVTLL